MVFKKIIFQNRYVAFETLSRPSPNTILNFHFDYPHPSLNLKDEDKTKCRHYYHDDYYHYLEKIRMIEVIPGLSPFLGDSHQQVRLEKYFQSDQFSFLFM